MEDGPTRSPFEALANQSPDLIHCIFSHLPKKQWLVQRRLCKRKRHILDASLINHRIAPTHIDDEAKAMALFESQQAEIRCLIENKKAILNIPKFETQMVRPDEELIAAFEELEKLPQDYSMFSLYQRDVVLSDVNLHIIYNKYNYDQLSSQFIDSRMVDLSRLYLTRIPIDIFALFYNINFLKLPLIFNAAHNFLKSVPLHIQQLCNLKILDLSNNQIRALPVTMHALGELEILLLANNQLEEIPLAVANLPKLRVLDVRRNYLQDLPPEFKEFKLQRPLNPMPPLSDSRQDFHGYCKALPQMLPTPKAMVFATQRNVFRSQVKCSP